MARVLTGIQSSGRPHLGNILGAIVPAIQLIEQNSKEESFIFIADFHSLTSQKDGEIRKQNTLAVAAAWLAFGLDIEKTVFYRQSRIPEVAELNWYLNCFAPFPMLANAHSFKDKAARLADVNAGLFTYPVLMADILLYSADLVPVGKDQLQHLEMARDLASTFNHVMEEDILTLPEARIATDVMTIPGTDGQKMSKSYQNILDIFLSEKELKKNVNTIVTDSTPLEEPKNPDTCTVFKLYSLIASASQTEALRAQYMGGNFGYGHAKKELLELLLTKFEKERERFDFFMNHPEEIESRLHAGEAKARQVAFPLLNRVREKLGFL